MYNVRLVCHRPSPEIQFCEVSVVTTIALTANIMYFNCFDVFYSADAK